MNPQPLSKIYRSGVKDEFDLTGSNSNRYRDSRWVQKLKQVEILPLIPSIVWTLSNFYIQKFHPLKVSTIRHCS